MSNEATNLDAVCRRVRKLLALTQSNNAAEAASAAAKAQALMDAHNIEASAIGGEGEFEEPIERNDPAEWLHVENGTRRCVWREILAGQIAKHNHCVPYTTQRFTQETGWRHAIGTIGRRSDARTASYVFEYAKREIERLATARTRGRRERNSFCLGATREFCRRIEASRASVVGENTSGALALRNRGREVEKWVDDNQEMEAPPPTKSAQTDVAAEWLGRLSAQSIVIPGAAPQHQVGEGQRKIGDSQ